MATRGTSIPEQAIFYYVKRVFPDAVNRKKFPTETGKKYEADIFIPSIKVAIEYNGVYWHKNLIERDLAKNTFFANNSIFSIIVREGTLQNIQIKNGIILTHRVKGSEGLHMDEVITAILHELAKHTNDSEQKKAASNFILTYENYEIDYPIILKRIFTKPCKENITNNCVFRMWDYEKNKGIDPTSIPKNTTARLWFRCPDGHSFRTAPHDWNYSHLLYDKCDNNCDVCVYNICPFLSSCPPYSHYKEKNMLVTIETCKFLQNQIWSCITGESEWPKKYGSQLAFMINRANSGLEMELLRKYFESKTTDEEKRKIRYIICHPFDLEGNGGGYVQPPSDIISYSNYSEFDCVRASSANTSDDLEICKRIIVEWNCNVSIKFENFQDGGERQQAACDFLDWVIRFWKKNHHVLDSYMRTIKNTLCSGSINEEFKTQLRDVVKNKSLETGLQFDDYLEDSLQ